MVSSITQAIQTQPAAQYAAASTQKPAASSLSAITTDTVNLSAAAQAAVAAMKEAGETPAQTSQEAGHGDLQALRLLARQAAAKPAAE